MLPANAADGPAAVAFWDEAAAMHDDWLGPVEGVFVDRSFNGVFRQHLARRCGIRVEKPAHMLVEKTNCCIHVWRWIVGRTVAWLSANHRLSRECDRGLPTPTLGFAWRTSGGGLNSANSNSFLANFLCLKFETY